MKVAPLKIRVAGALLLGTALFWIARDASADLPEDCGRLGGALVDHSCFHSKYGPFVSVQTTPSEDDAPNVDPVHTEYRLGLSGERSVVTYSPLRNGDWSVFLGEDVPLTVIDPDGRELERLLSVTGSTGCDALPISHVYELVARKRYQLRFGPAPSRELVIVIEYVDDFLATNGRDADGDGYGSDDDTVATSCTPPDGYAPNASDCDDGDPDINPGRDEECDGVDQNCNGVADDLGLSCWNGENACRVTGVWSCGPGDALAVCDAVPLGESKELCNGIDDDCDGEIDDGDGLCSDPERPLCVRHGQTASCGCLLDVDCGLPDSGQVCDAAAKRCIEGCSDAPGRNGCPGGFTCRFADGDPSCEPDELVPTAGAGCEGPLPPDDKGVPAALDSQSQGCGCRLTGSSAGGEDATLFAALIALGVLRFRRARTRAARANAANPSWVPGLSLVAMILPGCGGVAESDPDVSQEAPPGSVICQPVLEEKPVTHACSHTTNGPFRDVVASASPETGDVSQLHQTFVVDTLDSGASLVYEAQRDGEHVLMTDHSVALRLLDARSRPISSEAFEIEGCETIAEGRSATLEKGAKYRIEIEQRSPRHFNLFIEHLGAFRAPWLHSCSQ
jgi:hypothetical protein